MHDKLFYVGHIILFLVKIDLCVFIPHSTLGNNFLLWKCIANFLYELYKSHFAGSFLWFHLSFLLPTPPNRIRLGCYWCCCIYPFCYSLLAVLVSSTMRMWMISLEFLKFIITFCWFTVTMFLSQDFLSVYDCYLMFKAFFSVLITLCVLVL